MKKCSQDILENNSIHGRILYGSETTLVWVNNNINKKIICKLIIPLNKLYNHSTQKKSRSVFLTFFPTIIWGYLASPSCHYMTGCVVLCYKHFWVLFCWYSWTRLNFPFRSSNPFKQSPPKVRTQGRPNGLKNALPRRR